VRLSTPAAGARVLVHTPGPRIAETVHALLDQGAVVAVLADPVGASRTVADLATRRLVTLDADPAIAAYDVVIRDPLTAAPQPAEPSAAAPGAGRVVLVGGGPGHPGLLTLAGYAALHEADVVVCDRLAPLGLLDTLDPDVRVIHVGKIPRGEFTPQEQINALLVEHALAGRTVVRLKGGDSFVLGRGGEEWNACVAAGVPVTVVPGITSSVAAPALAGIPVTHRDLAQGFVVVSGHVGPDDPRSTVDWGAVAGTGLTVVVLMGLATLEPIVDALMSGGLQADTPAACVADAGLPSQRVVRAPMSRLAAAVAAADLRPPAVTVIGTAVAALSEATPVTAPGHPADGGRPASDHLDAGRIGRARQS